MRTEAEVEKAFDVYHLYTKGSVVVKMIRDLVGEHNFREGVRRFVTKTFRVLINDLYSSSFSKNKINYVGARLIHHIFDRKL